MRQPATAARLDIERKRRSAARRRCSVAHAALRTHGHAYRRDEHRLVRELFAAASARHRDVVHGHLPRVPALPIPGAAVGTRRRTCRGKLERRMGWIAGRGAGRHNARGQAAQAARTRAAGHSDKGWRSSTRCASRLRLRLTDRRSPWRSADLRTDTSASLWPALVRRRPPNRSLGRRRQLVRAGTAGPEEWAADAAVNRRGSSLWPMRGKRSVLDAHSFAAASAGECVWRESVGGGALANSSGPGRYDGPPTSAPSLMARHSKSPTVKR